MKKHLVKVFMLVLGLGLWTGCGYICPGERIDFPEVSIDHGFEPDVSTIGDVFGSDPDSSLLSGYIDSANQTIYVDPVEREDIYQELNAIAINDSLWEISFSSLHGLFEVKPLILLDLSNRVRVHQWARYKGDCTEFRIGNCIPIYNWGTNKLMYSFEARQEHCIFQPKKTSTRKWIRLTSWRELVYRDVPNCLNKLPAWTTVYIWICDPC